MYDELSELYDLFVDWPSRLGNELPLLEKLGVGRRGQNVVDVACGTGHHAMAWAERGCKVRAYDASREMIETAKKRDVECSVAWSVAGFSEIEQDGWADALVCLGTSLPHAASEDEYAKALAAFAGALKPGGLLIVHSRNLQRTIEGGRDERFLPPLARKRDGKTVLFWRFYDVRTDRELDFNLAILQETGDKWKHTVLTSRLFVLPAVELTRMATAAGFVEVAALGSLDGRAFNTRTSPDMVLVARRG